MKLEQVQVATNIGGSKLTAEVTKEFPETLDEAKQVYGESVVFDLFKKSARIDLQGKVRNFIEKNKSSEGAQSIADAWVPGTAAPLTKEGKLANAKQVIATLSPEERAAFIAGLGF